MSNNAQNFKLQCEAWFWIGFCKHYMPNINDRLKKLEEYRGKPQNDLSDEIKRQFKVERFL